jgi:hypothetical protein
MRRNTFAINRVHDPNDPDNDKNRFVLSTGLASSENRLGFILLTSLGIIVLIVTLLVILYFTLRGKKTDNASHSIQQNESNRRPTLSRNGNSNPMNAPQNFNNSDQIKNTLSEYGLERLLGDVLKQ